MEEWEIEGADDDELEAIAIRMGVDPDDYDWL